MIPSMLDLTIIGAGPSGLATAIAASQAGMEYTILEKGVLVNSIYQFPAHMVFFTTPELLEIGGLPLVTPYEKPTRIEALRYYRRVAEKFGLAIEFGEQVAGLTRDASTGVLTVSTQSSERHADAAVARRRAGHRLLRSSEPSERAWRGPAARLALLHRRTQQLPPARRRRRGQELRGGGCARTSSRRRARDAGAPAAGAQRIDQVLGQAGHREPDCRGIDSRALRGARRRNHARRGDRRASRPARGAAGRSGVPADRLSRGLHAPRGVRRLDRPRDRRADLRRGGRSRATCRTSFLPAACSPAATRRPSSSRTAAFMANGS